MTDRIRAILIGSMGLAFAGTVQAADPAPAKPQPPTMRDYAYLADHNIFLRDRAAYVAQQNRPPGGNRGPQVQPPIEQSLVLRGLVVEDDGLRAYVEDMRRNQMLRFTPGDTVLNRGKIAKIDIESVDYESGGEHTLVTIGSDFTGRVSSGDALASPGGGGGFNPNDPNLTPEQRLQLRRQQEMGGGGGGQDPNQNFQRNRNQNGQDFTNQGNFRNNGQQDPNNPGNTRGGGRGGRGGGRGFGGGGFGGNQEIVPAAPSQPGAVETGDPNLTPEQRLMARRARELGVTPAADAAPAAGQDQGQPPPAPAENQNSANPN